MNAATDPDDMYMIRVGVEMYLARCDVDRREALRTGCDHAVAHWDERIPQARALLERLGGPVIQPQPSPFVRQPRTVIRGRRTQLTCDDDA